MPVDRRPNRTKRVGVAVTSLNGEMMTMARRIVAVLALMVVFALSFRAGADDAPPALDLYMVMTMAGVTAGTVKLSIGAEADTIASSLKMKSQGLFELITGYVSRSEARSALHPETGEPTPISFDTTYETDKSERRVAIRYDPDNGRITTLENWKRGEPRKSKVPKELRADTVDPLTAVLQFRHWIRQIRRDRVLQTIGTGESSAPTRRFEIFDGRRRYRLDLELLGRDEVRFDGDRLSAFKIKVEMTPVAGFSSRDMLANWANENGQRWIELIVTDDDNPAPFSLKTMGGGLETKVYLRKICVGEAKCRKA
jgi:hypothetical protein